MAKYLLELENWVEYELVSAFTSFDRAKLHGQENFPQNKWRVVRPDNGNVIYEHDPFAVIACEAALEIQRFEETERWRRIFADRQAEQIRRQQERERLSEIMQRRYAARAAAYTSWDDIAPVRRNPLEQRVNWLKEGF